MQIKIVDIRGNIAKDIITEIMFEIASARAEGAELVKFELSGIVENDTKLMSFLTKKLKQMKQKGQVQFYALADDFGNSTTEAVFLLNKFPDHFKKISSDQHERYIYLKI